MILDIPLDIVPNISSFLGYRENEKTLRRVCWSLRIYCKILPTGKHGKMLYGSNENESRVSLSYDGTSYDVKISTPHNEIFRQEPGYSIPVSCRSRSIKF